MNLHHGDCLDVMADMEPESVDAIVTDPPYDLTDIGRTLQMAGNRRHSRGFMGKSWDGTRIAFEVGTWEAAYRVAKPSAYLLAFGGTRTVHRMTCAIEDAGWIIRDMLVWAYASGFPKSKASLKPAWEPIVMARKPGPLRELAIDACRIGIPEGDGLVEWGEQHGGRRERRDGSLYARAQIYGGGEGLPVQTGAVHPQGRWPANVLLTDPIFDGGIAGVVGGGETHWQRPETRAHKRADQSTHFDGTAGRPAGDPDDWYDDTGTYSRFFQLPRGESCDWCGASTAAPSSFQPSQPDGSAPTRARTSLDGTLASTAEAMGSRTTSGTGQTSWHSESEPTSRTRPSPGSRPAALNLSSDPANNAARLRMSSDTIPTTTNRRLCSSCADGATPSFMAEQEFAASRNYPIAFLVPKADRTDREPVLGGLPLRDASVPAGPVPGMPRADGSMRGPVTRANVHPTVKPVDLMRHLVRLVTPTGGIVLDPFLGSGTTALAAEMEGFPWIGIEREAEYVAIAEARLNGTQRGLGLPA